MADKKKKSPEEMEKAQKRQARQAKRRKKRKVRRIILTYLLTIFLLVGVIGGYVVYQKIGKNILAYREQAIEVVGNSSIDNFRRDETSTVYDSKGKKIREIKGEKEVYYKTYDEIPAAFVEAMVSVEDRRFYEHNGVDYEGIMRAAYILFQNEGTITQGASTITQQLARGIFLTNEVSAEKTNADKYARKFKEIFIAWELEKKYTKQDILEFYLNNIFFANGYYGIGAAAKGYFDKDLDEVTTSEAAFLCGIPNSPTYYDPRVNYDHTIERRDKILNDMHELGYINDIELQMALDEKIELAEEKKVSHDYVETFANFCATEALMEASGFKFQYKFDNIDEQHAYNEKYRAAYDETYQTLYTGGYQIYTSIDQSKQKALQKTINETLSVDEEKNEETGIYNLQGAATCIDNSNGRVVAIVGGRTQSELEGYSLNRAYQSPRQPGSTIKPLIVYTPQLERGYTPATRVDDNKFEKANMPENSGLSYSGMISLAQAVAASKNVVAYRLFGQLTPEVGAEYLLNMNFNYLTIEDRQNMAACLGGLTYGATTVEMASGYSTIENDGEFRKPTCIVSITDSQGNVIVEDKVKSKEVYEMNACRMMTSMLKGVFTGGTASGLGIQGMSCAGKTGTTDNNTDGWFCAYTPYYTTSVWVGYDTPQATRGLWGSTYPGRIWHDFMAEIHEGLKDIKFPDYEWVRSTKDWKDTRSSSETEDDDKKKKKKKKKKDEKTTEVSTEPSTAPTVPAEPEQPTQPTPDPATSEQTTQPPTTTEPTTEATTQPAPASSETTQ
ncbi:MAG: transglycosylase domain-containing protein [Clostridiales bacterium]|nr:transglycosylase domain-containing protein [Clostridiales bacterium]